MVGGEMKQVWYVRNDVIKNNLIKQILDLPTDNINYCEVVIKDKTRSLPQNNKFHAICSDIAKSGFEWAEKPRNSKEWKVLLVSGHSIATDEPTELVKGLESELINIRESTALMSVKRANSLIEYSVAFCAENGIKLNDTYSKYGW